MSDCKVPWWEAEHDLAAAQASINRENKHKDTCLIVLYPWAATRSCVTENGARADRAGYGPMLAVDALSEGALMP